MYENRKTSDELNVIENTIDEMTETSLRHFLKDWALNSKTHGLSNIVRSPNWPLRVIYIICFLICTGYCFWQSVNLILSYSQFNVITSYQTINEAPAVFPAVVICNLNAYDASKARNEIDKVLNAKNFSMNNYTTLISYLDDVTYQFKSTFEIKAINGTLDLRKMSFSLEEMLISCKFQGIECNTSDFTYFHDYNYGACYRFNGQPESKKSRIRMQRKAGISNGLRLELFTGNPTTQQEYTYKSGMRVIVHNQSVVAFPHDDGVDVPAGAQTNLAVSRTFVGHLEWPYNDCVDRMNEATARRRPRLHRLWSLFGLNETYSQKYCIKACIQERIVDECSCYDLRYPVWTNVSVNGCARTQEVWCVENHELKFFNSKMIEQCYEECPIECTSVDYTLISNQAYYPSDWYAAKLVNSPSIRKLLGGNSSDVDYISLVKRKAPDVTLDQLIALVGGNLGLFLGISLMTLVETIELGFYLFCVSIGISKNK